ncbi:putative fasciclin domain family protein [Podospora aff. communis PSN243]|uniref:Fasciclin domain family protein n=1 Tax=Podospora aff. communis PSN243 TaxID=3040156 RepID=A0AAV9GYJ1_9PEZI|nr:putative fasciclin domain family protein [Podospora aff. communis PSN243]
MKQAVLLLSAAAAALVTPKAFEADQAVISNDNSEAHWWDSITQSYGLQSLADSFEHAIKDAEAALDHDHDHDDDGHHHHGGNGKHGHHGHHPGDTTKTIYELISSNKHTTRFAALVDEHDDIKSLLQDTKANHTLFIPTDRAFERLPHHGDDGDDKDKPKKPPAHIICAILAYHVAPGLWPSRRLYFTHTLPTELTSPSLGSHPQRLRISSSLIFGTRLNFFSKLVVKDIAAKNGLIHAVDFILVPPPPTAKILQLLPNTFSTLSLGLENTGLGEELADLTFEGGTFFAPTNRAFTRLGPRANAFLFSDRGKKYLKALIKYSIVANETLYSDAFYKRKGGEDVDAERDYWHVDLPSLLEDKPISVDVRTWKGWVSIVANGYTRVAVQDVLARDGVLQVVNSVLFPPRRGGRHEWVDEEEREWEVEEIVERLEGYVERERESGMGDL